MLSGRPQVCFSALRRKAGVSAFFVFLSVVCLKFRNYAPFVCFVCRQGVGPFFIEGLSCGP